MPEKPTITQRLHRKKLRATPHRILLLNILESSEEHLDAEAIFQQAQAHDPGISLATVYRTLRRLEECGLVMQRYFARDHQHDYYEAASKREHYHFTCTACRRVFEFETDSISELRAELKQQLGVTFRHACLCFEGLCAECRDTPDIDTIQFQNPSLER